MMKTGQCIRGHCIGHECDSSCWNSNHLPHSRDFSVPALCASQQQPLQHPFFSSSITLFCDSPFAVVTTGTAFQTVFSMCVTELIGLTIYTLIGSMQRLQASDMEQRSWCPLVCIGSPASSAPREQSTPTPTLLSSLHFNRLIQICEFRVFFLALSFICW